MKIFSRCSLNYSFHSFGELLKKNHIPAICNQNVGCLQHLDLEPLDHLNSLALSCYQLSPEVLIVLLKKCVYVTMYLIIVTFSVYYIPERIVSYMSETGGY